MEWILFRYLQFLTAFQGRYGHHQRWPSGCSGWVVVGVPVWRSWTRAQSLCRTKSYPFKRCLIQTFIFFLANTEWCEIWSSFLTEEWNIFFPRESNVRTWVNPRREVEGGLGVIQGFRFLPGPLESAMVEGHHLLSPPSPWSTPHS